MSAIDGSKRSASVISLGNVKLGIINYTFFRNNILEDADFCRSLLVKFTRIVRRSNQQIFSLATIMLEKDCCFSWSVFHQLTRQTQL